MTVEELARLRDVFARNPGVAAVWLFGSRARGEARTASDVDLAIEPADAAIRERKLDMLTDLVRAGRRPGRGLGPGAASLPRHRSAPAPHPRGVLRKAAGR